VPRPPAADRPLDLLAIGAHPDDVDISCGGTLALAAAQGYAAGILDLTRGELGTNGTPEMRAEEAAEAARLLGAKGRWNVGLPDGAIRSLDSEQERRVVEWIRRLRPAILLTHFPKDRHPDHVQASFIAERASYLAGLARYKADGEPFRPAARFHFLSRVAFQPTLVIDVTEMWETKRRAMLAHKSQVTQEVPGATPTQLNQPDFLERIEVRMRHYGGMIGVRYGEPYYSDAPMGARALASIFGAPRPVPGAFTG
jgi:bacillithiol biosynthesis deacetylase BshB1